MKNPKTAIVRTGDGFEEKNEISIGLAIPDHRSQNNPIETEMKMAAASMLEPSVDDLPDEVKKNLIGYDDMENEQLLLKVLAQYSCPITVDRIVLTLWHNFKKTIDRMKIIRHLNQMNAKNLVLKVAGKRGIYSISDDGLKVLGG